MIPRTAKHQILAFVAGFIEPIIWVTMLAFVSFWTGQAHADQALLTWTPPTQNTDGSALNNLTSFKVYHGTAPGVYPDAVSVLQQSATSYTWTNIASGPNFFVVTALNSSGVESMRSNEAMKLGSGAVPNPPTVPAPKTLGGPVFTLQITRDSVVLPQVGTVVAGKACDPTQQLAFGGKTYMIVANQLANVTPLPGTAIEAAWALCQ